MEQDTGKKKSMRFYFQLLTYLNLTSSMPDRWVGGRVWVVGLGKSLALEKLAGG